jgi:hypothetical protein
VAASSARISARPIAESIAPIHDFIDTPPTARLTAIDRDKPVPFTLKTLARTNAERLAETTRTLLMTIEHQPGTAM